MSTKSGGDKSKVTGVRSTVMSEGIERTGSVSEVEKAKKAAGIAGVRGLGGIGKTRATRIMTAGEREAIFTMIHEEADRLFGKGKLSNKQREVVETAVKMAVDAAIVDESEEKPENSGAKSNRDKKE